MKAGRRHRYGHHATHQAATGRHSTSPTLPHTTDVPTSEWILDLFATYLAKIYNFVVVIPRWVLFILTGAIGSIIINFLHRPSKKQPVRNAPAKREVATTPGAQPASNKPAPSAPAAKVKPEPSDNITATTTATASPPTTPRRNGKKGKGRKQQ